MLNIFIKIIVWLFRLDTNSGTVNVDGNGDIQINSLEGSPQKVGGGFDCNNRLESLEGAPRKIGWGSPTIRRSKFKYTEDEDTSMSSVLSVARDITPIMWDM